MTKAIAKFNIMQAVSKFREDIVIANPVSFLVRAMSGEEFEGEKLSLRERVEVAKFLGARIVPTVAPEERGIGSAAPVTPPPLTIVLHATPGEVQGAVRDNMFDVTPDSGAGHATAADAERAGVDTMTVVGEHKADEGDEDHGNDEEPAGK